jgi:hypothetical protein
MSAHSTADLLVEIGTEELPPSALAGLSEAFRDGLLSKLDDSRLGHGAQRPSQPLGGLRLSSSGRHRAAR